MKWKIPPQIKIYEALGSIADGRVEVKDNSAKVYSSSRGKFYHVMYNPIKKAIVSNDNGSFWQGYLGYPSIAFLMIKGEIKYDKKLGESLRDIKWKDINTQFNNDFEKTAKFVDNLIVDKGVDLNEFKKELGAIQSQIEKLNLQLLEPKLKPPSGY